jgi:ATP/maltotriose-dependent transcriptional regulator MalT
MNKNLSSTFYLIILIFVFSGLANGQVPAEEMKINSLFNELKVKPNSIEKVDNLISLFKDALKKRVTRKDIINEALDVAKKIYYIDGIAECYSRKGITARYESDYSQSIAYHKRALTYFDKTTDTLSKIKCLNSIGVTYRKLNMEKEAFDNYFQALELSESSNDDRSIAIALSGIANVFINTEEYDKALHYLRKGLAVETKNENPRGQEYALANIGEVYLNKQVYDSAYNYFNRSLKIAIAHPRKDGEAIKYNLLGLFFQKKGDYETSTDYYKRSIPLLTEFKNKRYLSNTLINIGKNELYTQDFKNAISNIEEGLSTAKSIHSKENIILGYNALVDYYSLTHNYKKALDAHKSATIFHDSIVNEASQKSIISTQIAYETGKKDKQIQALAQEKAVSEEDAKTNLYRLIIGSIVSIVIIIILIVLFYLYRKNSDLELQNIDVELKKYILQINELKGTAEHKAIITNQEFTEKFKSFELSNREIEVHTHIANGLSNVEIADKMFVSINTIKTHIKNIYVKLDVKNRIQAMKKIGI